MTVAKLRPGALHVVWSRSGPMGTYDVVEVAADGSERVHDAGVDTEQACDSVVCLHFDTNLPAYWLGTMYYTEALR